MLCAPLENVLGSLRPFVFDQPLRLVLIEHPAEMIPELFHACDPGQERLGLGAVKASVVSRQVVCQPGMPG